MVLVIVLCSICVDSESMENVSMMFVLLIVSMCVMFVWLVMWLFRLVLSVVKLLIRNSMMFMCCGVKFSFCIKNGVM